MNEQPQKRRAMDVYNFDIEHLIAGEEDPKQRVYLIVLNNLNNSLVANTDTIRSVSSKLDTHLANFEIYTRDKDAMLNKGRGAWKVAAWILGVAQVAVMSAAIGVRGEFADLHATDARIETALATITQTLRLKEKP
jgi:hypothetical protein